uniref:Cardiolipin synthase (CMP-forming) n=1 Tax=Phallusia mammillata TaxID=59560 RepID=A0A6F9DF59_9ASCI|nr:cardiolipin synthase [Phallusia mammillata]
MDIARRCFTICLKRNLQLKLVYCKYTSFSKLSSCSVWCPKKSCVSDCGLKASKRLVDIKICFQQIPLQFFGPRFYSDGQNKDQPDKWENLLDNEEKQEKISELPVKRENIYTIPNLLSLCRLCLTPYLAHLVITNQHKMALTLFVLASVSDVIDGQIARRWPSQQSALGSALDPLADKILVAVLCGALTYVNIIPLPLTLLFIGRDLLLIASVFYLRFRTCPPPRTLKRFFDPTLVNAKLSPTFISKVNTTLQMVLIWCSVAAPAFDLTDHVILKCLWGITAVTTVASGLSYITRKDTVRILKDDG